MPYTIANAPSSDTSGMGANLRGNGPHTSFRVWAPNASRTQLRIRPDSNAPFTELDLAQDHNPEYWSADLDGVTDGDRYRFLITNNQLGPLNPGGLYERIDPYARYAPNPDAAAWAVVIDPSFGFTQRASLNFADYNIYQLHVGSFAGLNDPLSGEVVNRVASFRQLCSPLDNKLDYIRDLNFNAVQFLPTSQSPAATGEGYAPENFFAPESAFGAPADLRFLVDQCHRRGLAVIFDVVYNHVVAADADDRLLRFDGNIENNNRGIYFSVFDNFGPVPNFDKSAVRDFFIDNARMLFREYDVDGLRFDSAHAIRGSDGSPKALHAIVGQIASEFPDKFLIAEFDNPTFAVTQQPFNAAWAMGCADQFIDIINSGSVYAVQGAIERWGYPNAYSPVRFLLGSHDQIFAEYDVNGNTDKPNNRYFVERVGGVITGRLDWTARAKARMGWSLNATMPSTPMMFMGTECHHYGYWTPALDHYGEHRFNWDLTRDTIGSEMRNLVRDINALRASHTALRGDTLAFPHLDAQSRVLAFKRWNYGGDLLLIVLNMSDNQWDHAEYGVNMGGEQGTWEEIFNSQSPQYGGWNDSGNYLAYPSVRSDGTIRIRLPKWSVLVLRKT
jgi:1,4-alpha-glucan branching enzyme